VDKRGKRVGRNEVLFREVNERLRELGEGFSLVSEGGDFVCECADTSCTEHVRMPLETYEQIRSKPTRFFVIRGHEEPDFEQIIEEQEVYLVVEKLPGGAAGLAIREDPRS
jgi:hypothetical protein